jgi:chromosome segregation ATPase
LSRVIVGLGQPNQTHIHFRDSKLTRILQPSLSENARKAVICCATPSELYLEETRSTLLFASRAKLVKTRPRVTKVQSQPPPKRNTETSSPQCVPQARKKAKLIKEAHNSKVEQNKILQERDGETEKKVADDKTLVSRAAETTSALRAEKKEAIEEFQRLSSEMSSLFTEIQAATLRHENAIAAKDTMISEWADKQKVEQSSRQSLEVTMSAPMKELESLENSLRTTERQAMEDSLKAAEEKAHLEESVRLLSSEKSTLIDEVNQNRAEQVVSNQEIVELKLEKQGLGSRIDSLSKGRLLTALEVAQVNNEKASLARGKKRINHLT